MSDGDLDLSLSPVKKNVAKQVTFDILYSEGSCDWMLHTFRAGELQRTPGAPQEMERGQETPGLSSPRLLRGARSCSHPLPGAGRGQGAGGGQEAGRSPETTP